jgi:hypothetical protein
MAQERSPTPEKQLLKLIEDPKAQRAKAKEKQVKHKNLSFLSFGAWKGRSSFAKDSVGKWLKGGGLHRIDVKAVNRVLILCIFLLFFYLAGSIYLSAMDLGRMPDIEYTIDDAKEVAVTPAHMSVLKDKVSYYLERAQQRDIFKMGIPEVMVEEAEIEEPVAAPTSQAIDAISALRLVGISWSAEPDAMIEDTRTMRTYFVHKGQTIGDIIVEAIFKDKVVLSYKGEEVELR